MVSPGKAELILTNGTFHTVDRENPIADAVAIREGKFLAVGSLAEVMQHHCEGTKIIDLKRHTAVPGLNDSHLHLIRGGLNYNLELRWEGVPSLSDALRMLKEQALRTPTPQWVRVVGGWTEFQFAERRMPTLDEINEAAPDTPVFILHLYDRALLNRAALKVVGYTKDTPNPPGGEIQRDSHGNPTGMLIARPNAMILYSTLAKGPKLPLEQQINSTRQFMRELNRLGLTSAIDAGGGFQNYPEDYAVIAELHQKKQMTIRIAYNLFTQRPGHELEDFEKWTDMLTPGQGSDYFRHNGAGEMLVFRRLILKTFSNLGRIWRPAWKRNWSAWYATWLNIVGHSACMRLITNPSAACLMSLRESTAIFRLTACTGSLIMPKPLLRRILIASKNWVAELLYSIVWRFRVNILPNDTVWKPHAIRHRLPVCSKRVCLLDWAPMQPA